jgi:protein subunit release factor A
VDKLDEKIEADKKEIQDLHKKYKEKKDKFNECLALKGDKLKDVAATKDRLKGLEARITKMENDLKITQVPKENQ